MLKIQPQPAQHSPELPSLTRIMLVDDHPLLRYALRTLLSLQRNLLIEAECNCAKEAITLVRTKKPDLIITDITLPGGMDGLELIKSIHSENPKLPIIVLSIHDESIYALRSIAAGAMGYITKERPVNEVLAAIRSVISGKIQLSEAIAERLHVKNQTLSGRQTHDLSSRLSDRELEILLLIGKSLSTVEISECLRISIKTIETHRRNLRRKLALEGGGELIRYAIAWRFGQEH